MEPAAIANLIDERLSNSQGNILSDLDTLMTRKLDVFRHEFQDSQREISEIHLAKISQINSDTYSFKRKGNEEQHKINLKVSNKMKEAHLSLQENPEPNSFTNKAANRISEGIALLSHRQKLVKLADQSETGWKVVEEYETNALASDSEDEKRIIRAENRAQRKIKTQKSNRGRRFNPYGAPRQQPTFTVNQEPVAREKTSQAGVGGLRRHGLCYRCGKPGHWRAECVQALSAQGQDKISKKIIFIPEAHVSVVSVFLPDSEGPTDTRGTFCKSSKAISPVGKLRNSFDEWQKVGACSNVLDIIRYGYKLPLYELPCDILLLNNKSARENISFVRDEITSLLEKGCISEVLQIPKIVNPLTVAGNKEKLRLVLDCRHVNPCLHKFVYRYEDHSVALDMFSKGDYLFTFDLKSAYHHIEIFPDHRTYLGFSCDFERKHKYFVFNVLPFGLSTAGYVFSKVTRVLVKYWRSMGYRLIMYLDDGISGHSDRNSSLVLSKIVQDDLSRFGFLISEEKCVWEPSDKVVWLGLLWNMSDGKVYITEKRLSKLTSALQNVLDSVSRGHLSICARELACVIGQIISMKVAMGNVVRLMTRSMYSCVLTKKCWDSNVYLFKEAVDEMRFWFLNLVELNGCLIDIRFTHDFVLFSDASATGYGGYVLHINDSEVIGKWSDSEKKESSTWRELEAVLRMLRHFEKSLIGRRLTGRKILWYSDNQNVISIILNGSMKMKLQYKAKEIFRMCVKNNFAVIPAWVPRSDNHIADIYSKSSDSDDWSISDDLFNLLSKCWGPFTVDRFSSDYNAKCEIFNSRWWCPGTSGIDAFNQIWSFDNNWLVPPPRLIPKVVSKLIDEKASATMIVPFWTSAPFWPVIAPSSRGFACFIKEQRVFNSDSVIKGKGRNGVFGRCEKLRIVALKIRFD